MFFRGREVLDPDSFADYLFPDTLQLEHLSESHLAYHGTDHAIPGYPANQRMQLARLYLQMGVYLDYYTGVHEPSLSEVLYAAAQHDANPDSIGQSIPREHWLLFPQLDEFLAWPPTFLVHGSADTAVKVVESENMANLLRDAGIETELRILDGLEHSMDLIPEAEEHFGELFDEIRDFIVKHLKV